MEDKKVVVNIGELVTYDSSRAEMVIHRNVDMVIENGLVCAIGRNLVSPEFPRVDAHGALVTPGFVDPHTHPVFGATREFEFEMRIQGKTYQEIAAAGGGIRSSVRSLREMSIDQLRALVGRRLDQFLCFGTTTIEAKSGYGLSVDSEIRSLQLLRDFRLSHPLDIRTTFLGAHEFPDEYRDDHEAYIDLLIGEMLPRVVREGLADFCDVFCEEGIFSVEESRRVLEAARCLGLGLRIHADEFKPIGGVPLAARLGAVSADHLMAITEEGIEILRTAGIVPVILPATTFFLGSSQYAPARRMWQAGLPVALATDFNPGSSMTQSMPLVIALACICLKLTPLEALQAATIHAAQSLRMEKVIGSLEPGKQADWVIWDCEHYQGIPYFLGYQLIRQVWKRGKLVYQKGGAQD